VKSDDTRARDAADDADTGAAGGDSPEPPLALTFEPTPEIFATDKNGGFSFVLQNGDETFLDTSRYDECRLIFSVWHPSERRSIDLDRAYLELRASFDPEDDRWTRIAEIEPVVPPYGSDSFDGWIVLPVLGAVTAWALFGSGFEPRAQIQIRSSAYLVP
jgi:hypothetical protein